ncbi:MAG: GNAT family N-acetyltransferase [Eubacteriales bacterium]|nr:GNAT family N-acetyltransferase [Eubacteriales bacterium]
MNRNDFLKCLRFEENQLTVDRYFEFRKSVDWHNFSREQAESAIKKSFYLLTVWRENHELAMARVIGDGMYFKIVDVIVKPQYQGKGIGTLLIQNILKHIENNLPPNSRASIELTSEKGKERFYIRQGFKVLPNEYAGSSLRKVIYK